VTTLLRLDPPIWLTTPKGSGVAHVYADNGAESDSTWVVFHDDGQIWEYPNSKVRAYKNTTLERDNPEKPLPQ
jgi:hypothetical protein